AKMWFHQNPFYIKISRQEQEVHIVNQYHILVWNLLATHQAAVGDESDCNFYDEGGDVGTELKLYQNYEDTRPMLANSDFSHILHFSTPARSTALYEAKISLEKLEIELDTKLIFVRDYTWCPWTKKERVLAEAERHPEDPYWFQKNYMCMWVVYGGAVFNTTDFYDIRQVSPELRQAYEDIEPTHGGVDWNGEATKHFLGLMAFTDQYVFCKDEIKFLDFKTLKDWHDLVSLELEADDPFSNQFADDALEYGIRGIYQGWDNEMKMERIRQLKKRIIILDQVKCPVLYKNLQEAAYDKSKRLPTLLKRSDQHGLDWLMHAMHIFDGRMYYRGYTKEYRVPVAVNPFKK
ncbi:hypothetical protein LCGC14_3086210, partial [marine sediment metagenome]